MLSNQRTAGHRHHFHRHPGLSVSLEVSRPMRAGGKRSFDRADKQGLQHSLRLETGCQFRKAVFVETAARVGGGFLQLCHRQVAILIAALNCGFHKMLLLI